jgi:hypothetical protein
MHSPAKLRPVARAVIFVLAGFVLSQAVQAQLPPRLKRCLMYPTFADEIAEARAEQQAKQPPARAIVVDSLHFQSGSPLPKRLEQLLVKSIKTAPAKDNPDWLSELDAIRVVSPLQDGGYFRAVAHSTAQTLSEDAETKHVALTVSVDTGLRYRLGDVQFRSADPQEPLVFSVKRLQKCLRLRRGDIVDISKIRHSFTALQELYGASGWIDFTPTPQFQIDDRTRRINMTLELDQEKQYRVREIQFLGNDAAAERLIRSGLKIGEPFDGFFFQRFCATHKSILPPGASVEDVTLTRNSKTGAVKIQVDFRTCPSDSE